MATKTALNCAAVNIFARLDGQQVMNTLFYQLATQPTHVELVELAASIADVITETMFGYMPTSWVGQYVFAYDLTVADGANAVDDSILGLVGADEGSPLPNNVSLAIARKNGLRGRAGNGRVFWQGLPSSAMADENTVTSAYADLLVELMGTFDAAAEGLGWTPVILSYQNAGVVSSEATIYPITSWSVTDLVVDSQRRRLPGRGR